MKAVIIDDELKSRKVNSGLIEENCSEIMEIFQASRSRKWCSNY